MRIRNARGVLIKRIVVLGKVYRRGARIHHAGAGCLGGIVGGGRDRIATALCGGGGHLRLVAAGLGGLLIGRLLGGIRGGRAALKAAEAVGRRVLLATGMEGAGLIVLLLGCLLLGGGGGLCLGLLFLGGLFLCLYLGRLLLDSGGGGGDLCGCLLGRCGTAAKDAGLTGEIIVEILDLVIGRQHVEKEGEFGLRQGSAALLLKTVRLENVDNVLCL